MKANDQRKRPCEGMAGRGRAAGWPRSLATVKTAEASVSSGAVSNRRRRLVADAEPLPSAGLIPWNSGLGLASPARHLVGPGMES